MELDGYDTLFFVSFEHNNKTEHSGGVSCTAFIPDVVETNRPQH